MTANEPEVGQAAPTTSRFVLGASVFVFGMFCPLFIPFVATSDLSTEWKAVVSGALLIGLPEVLTLVAVAIFGKPGYELMKRKAVSLLRRLRPADYVGPVRHRVGVAMFALPLAVGWLQPYIALWLTELAEYQLPLALFLDLVLLSSLFVLGGDFWDKLSALFVRTQPARTAFPSSG